MFRNYLKTAWRNITRNKGYTILNLLGFALGMAVALLIAIWAYYEYSFDRYLPKHSQIYQVQRNFDSNGEILTFNTTSLKLAGALATQVPEIEYVAESDWMNFHGLMVGEKKFEMDGAVAGSDFLKIFEYPLIYGHRHQVLKDPYSIVLTESTAKALFGDENPINKTVRFDNKDNLKVTGLMKDLPANSSFRFKYIVPYSYYDQTRDYIRQRRAGSFGQNANQIFIRLRDGVSYEKVAQKIKNIQHTEKDNRNAMGSEVILQPFVNKHLYSEYKNGKEAGGFIDYIRMFLIIGGSVLLIACINFVNLVTARSERRAREVGVRKAIGSRRWELILQFMTESFLLSLVSFFLAVLLVNLVLPSFNLLIGKQVTIPYSNFEFWIWVVAALLVTTLLAGSRPAFYLSSFRPVSVLKGSINTGQSASLPRKALVVVQYACSVALIISTIIVYQQIEHARNRPTGLALDRLMLTYSNTDLSGNYVPLRNELLSKGIVESVTTASSPATDIYWHSDIDQWPGKNAGETIEMATIAIGDDYFKTMGFQFAEGRGFEKASDSLNVVFNETAIKKMRIQNPLDQTITWSEQKFRIIGVVKDALMVSPYANAEPTMFVYDPDPQDVILYRVSKNLGKDDVVPQLSSVFSKYSPAFPYNYHFTQQNYEDKFNTEILIGKLAALFAGLAIFISCLGLFGLAAYTAERRTKEIGIRKTLGASSAAIVQLLFRGFLGPVMVATLVAIPLAYWAMNNWLQGYEYRVQITPVVFVVAGLTAVIIAAVTVLFQSLKAAGTNPVKSLKTE